jgi:class 3 adenylate cyclase/pimeloyl-ACP methyl ester carboxylesterase
MAPRVQYATTSDGVKIAYTVDGQGPTVVYLQPHSNQQLDWRHSEMVDWYSTLARDYSLIRYDGRNFGLSQRNAGVLSGETMMLDLEAVVQRAAPERFALVGVSGLGLTAIRFAARRPERVTRLITWATPASGEYFREAPRNKSLLAIAEFDEQLATELQVRYVFGDEVAINNNRVLHAKETMTLDDLIKYNSALYEIDVTAEMAKLSCSSLVVYPRLHSYLSMEMAQQMAATTPHAEFAVVDSGYYPYQGPDVEGCLSLFQDFLSADNLGEESESWGRVLAFRTILFTDIVASTPLLAQLKDEKMRAVMRDHDEVLQTAVTKHGGRVVKTMGDAFMAEFAVPSGAVEAAIAVQRGIRDRFAYSEVPVRLRIGVNAGEPIEEGGDLHGVSVVIAKRLESAAENGGILVSEVVRQAVAGKEFEFVDRGEISLKGFDEPVQAWSVEW